MFTLSKVTSEKQGKPHKCSHKKYSKQEETEKEKQKNRQIKSKQQEGGVNTTL